MPIREYHCEACGRDHEQIEFAGTDPLHQCPTCGGSVRRVFTAPAVHFSGYGWTPKFSGRGRKDPDDTLEETESGQLRDKTGAGHDAP